MNRKRVYVPPTAEVIGVELEGGVAQASPALHVNMVEEWESGGELNADEDIWIPSWN